MHFPIINSIIPYNYINVPQIILMKTYYTSFEKQATLIGGRGIFGMPTVSEKFGKYPLKILGNS